MSNKLYIRTPQLTAVYASVATPTKYVDPKTKQEGKPKYSVTFLVPKDHDFIKELNEKGTQLAKDTYNGRVPKNFLIGTDGDSKYEDDEMKNPGKGDERLKNHIRIAPSTAEEYGRPSMMLTDGRIIQRDASPEEIDKFFYAGAKMVAYIELGVYDNGTSKGISFRLKSLFFIEHGARLQDPSSDPRNIFGDLIQERALPEQEFGESDFV